MTSPPSGVARLRGLWRGETKSTSVQFLRYGVVGGVAFAADFGSLYALTEWAGVHYLNSAAIAFLIGLATNYTLSVLWVFPRGNLQSKWIEFGVFALIGAIGLAMNQLFIWFFTEKVAFHYLVSKLISTALVFLWNFFARKFILFRS
ncbi:MAG TPA: GtrA family protein [Candidatus Nitrosotenuis sp.]|nr:GtrA family protein [Candidatus Nitrosotenuis sp.]